MLLMENAPQKGTIYATFVDKMVYRKYDSLAEIEQYLTEEGLLELHLFDREKELRFMKTREKGIQRYEVSDKDGYDDVYEESLFVSGKEAGKQEKLSEKIVVVNYIRYDENDMIRIVNYRLKEVE